tara:strand:- start:10952 stop:11551 length:600 start_codon:yes stop_codon:yes gene_type:complete
MIDSESYFIEISNQITAAEMAVIAQICRDAEYTHAQSHTGIFKKQWDKKYDKVNIPLLHDSNVSHVSQWSEPHQDVANALVKRYGAKTAMVFCTFPNGEISKHIDFRGIRPCVLSVPLETGYAGTHFWTELEDEDPRYVCQYDTPVLLNIGKPHAVYNDSQYRYCFQLVFDKSYDETMERLLAEFGRADDARIHPLFEK